MTTKGIIFLLAMTTLGCLKFKDNSQHREERVESHQLANIQISWNTEPNSYFVNLSPPQGTDYILKSESNSSSAEVQVLELTKSKYIVDKNVQPAHAYTYRFIKGISPNKEVLQEIKIQIPNDLVLDKTEAVTDPKKFFAGYNRIFFMKGSELLISDLNIKIEAQEIISENGVIRTYPDNSTTKTGTDGRSGGTVSISACKLSGHLDFKLSGEAGGRGANGEKFKTDAPDGKNGTLNCNLGRVSITCEKQSEPTSGSDGARGHNGGNGGNGGNSGILTLKFVDDSEFSYSLRNDGGNGGDPGDRGEGQNGGRPGSWGQPGLPVPELPANLKAGSKGDPGEPGSRGFRGTSNAPTIESTNLKWCQ